jgi:hypothetical protein
MLLVYLDVSFKAEFLWEESVLRLAHCRNYCDPDRKFHYFTVAFIYWNKRGWCAAISYLPNHLQTHQQLCLSSTVTSGQGGHKPCSLKHTWRERKWHSGSTTCRKASGFLGVGGLIHRSLQVDIRYFYSLNLSSEETGGYIIWPKGEHSFRSTPLQRSEARRVCLKNKGLKRIFRLEREEAKGAWRKSTRYY